eukprot:m.102696 g.102696  ORF g.102696 m.102696 type:complete len:56 (+) comp15192_c0_seq2:141-308(+)
MPIFQMPALATTNGLRCEVPDGDITVQEPYDMPNPPPQARRPTLRFPTLNSYRPC